MITTTGLRKAYGEHLVLDGIDLDVAEGTVYALLGPNGAGKTTIVHILSTLISADDGEIHVAGHDLAVDPDGVRASIGLTGQFSAVDKLLTGRENLRLMADLNHLDRAEGEARATDAARAIRPGRGCVEAGEHVLRGHESPARPGDDVDGGPAADLPGRAHHRPRPAQPAHHVGHHPRSRRRWRHGLPHHAVPG